MSTESILEACLKKEIPGYSGGAKSAEAIAFAAALECVAGGGVLLFSPACASFDMFPNYRVRGERFKALVEQAGGGG